MGRYLSKLFLLEQNLELASFEYRIPLFVGVGFITALPIDVSVVVETALKVTEEFSATADCSDRARGDSFHTV